IGAGQSYLGNIAWSWNHNPREQQRGSYYNGMGLNSPGQNYARQAFGYNVNPGYGNQVPPTTPGAVIYQEPSATTYSYKNNPGFDPYRCRDIGISHPVTCELYGLTQRATQKPTGVITAASSTSRPIEMTQSLPQSSSPEISTKTSDSQEVLISTTSAPQTNMVLAEKTAHENHFPRYPGKSDSLEDAVVNKKREVSPKWSPEVVTSEKYPSSSESPIRTTTYNPNVNNTIRGRWKVLLKSEMGKKLDEGLKDIADTVEQEEAEVCDIELKNSKADLLNRFVKSCLEHGKGKSKGQKCYENFLKKDLPEGIKDMIKKANQCMEKDIESGEEKMNSSEEFELE
ncbi:hypothetical protein QAD02_010077, partial [Eretmocerus hayati]